MKEYPNFYENLKEAHIRLRNTVVKYDDLPMFVIAITDHMKDGIFRAYMYPVETKNNAAVSTAIAVTHDFPADHPGLGNALDKAIEGKEGVLRKHLNSPAFNRFRPFPLGMCNITGEGVEYIERQPTRHTPQGLTNSMLTGAMVRALAGPPSIGRTSVSMLTDDFKNCVIGKYPTPQECLAAMINPDIANEAAAFHRQFALVRGPIEMVFLAYKGDVIGVLPSNNFNVLKLGRDFRHLREAVQELMLFNCIEV